MLQVEIFKFFKQNFCALSAGFKSLCIFIQACGDASRQVMLSEIVQYIYIYIYITVFTSLSGITYDADQLTDCFA